jgi:hypothetical protein
MTQPVLSSFAARHQQRQALDQLPRGDAPVDVHMHVRASALACVILLTSKVAQSPDNLRVNKGAKRDVITPARNATEKTVKCPIPFRTLPPAVLPVIVQDAGSPEERVGD